MKSEDSQGEEIGLFTTFAVIST